MKSFIRGTIISLLSFNAAFAQPIDRKVTWECQYIMHKDTAGKTAIDKMVGVGSVKFESEKELNITGVCNTGSAKAEFGKDSTLRIYDITRTMLWCDQKSKEIEFLKFLSQTTGYEINKSGLKLFLSNKKEYLFFVGHQ